MKFLALILAPIIALIAGSGCGDSTLSTHCTDKWYPDRDSDGYSPEGAAAVESCSQPENYTADDGRDCDDDNDGVSPDAAEACNGLDDDCDGGVDEDLVADGFVDEDADGFGGATTACDPDTEDDADGVVDNDDDCNDGDSAINPDAPDEAGDGLDQDCNEEGLTGTVDIVQVTLGGFEGKDIDSHLNVTAIARRAGAANLLLLDGDSVAGFASWTEASASTNRADWSLDLETDGTGLAVASGVQAEDDGIIVLEADDHQIEYHIPESEFSSVYYDYERASGLGTACVWPEEDGWLTCAETATGDLVLIDITESEERAVKTQRDAWLSLEGSGGGSMAVADLDGDGLPEVITAGAGVVALVDHARLFEAEDRGDAVYATVEFPVDDLWVSVLGDIDDDGTPDLAVTGATSGWIISGATEGFGKQADAIAIGAYTVTDGDARQWVAFAMPDGTATLAVGLPSTGQVGIVSLDALLLGMDAPRLTEQVFDAVLEGDVGLGSSVIAGDLDPALSGDELVICNNQYDGDRGWCGVMSPTRLQ
jgi:hypothetical protein